MSKIEQEYQEKTRNLVLQKISSLQSVGVYIADKSKRIELSGLYKQVRNIGNGHPVASWFDMSIPTTLQKSISNSCPSCVKEAKMLSTIETAINHLQKYAVALRGVEIEIEPPKDIHDLRPNI